MELSSRRLCSAHIIAIPGLQNREKAKPSEPQGKKFSAWLRLPVYDSGVSPRAHDCVSLVASHIAVMWFGFECVSRGANSCVLVDCNPIICNEIKEKSKLFACLNVDVIRSDAMKFLMNNDELFDIVFLDPPFGTDLLKSALKIMEKNTVKKNSLVYVESHRGLESPEGWTVVKKSNSRNVEFMLLEKT